MNLTLYHGGSHIIKTPEIREPERFALFEGGIISKESLITELMTYKLVDQYLFHTDKSLLYLKYQTNKLIEL